MSLRNNIYFKLKNNLSRKQFINFNLFIILSIIAMLLEMFGISLIIPLINILIQDQINFEKFIFLNNLDLNKYPRLNLIIFSLTTLIFVYVSKTLFLTFVSYKQGKFIADVRISLSERLYLNYINKPYEYFIQNNSSKLIRNINDISLFLSLLKSTLMFITEVIILIGISLLLILYEPFGSLTTIIIISSLGIIFSKNIKNKSEVWGEKRRFADGERLKNMQESFRSIQEIKLLNKSNYFVEKFSKTCKISAESQFKHEFFVSLPKYWLELFAITGLTLLILILSFTNNSNINIITTLGLFAAATFRLLPSITRLINSLQQIYFGLPVLNNLLYEFNNQNNYLKVKINDFEILNFKKELSLRNISYKYKNSNHNVLENISFLINHGESIGIMGASGVGKTTLINIMMGLLTPSKGVILVDGIDVIKKAKSWQNNIGYVPQNIMLLDDTLKNNIAFGEDEKNIDLIKINKSIKESRLENFIKTIDNGIHAQVGELGVRLSGGQKQRIGIARALYKDPEIIFLDEFTSAIDGDTEREIINEINNLKKKKTIIMISHKLSALSKCDKVFQLTKTGLRLI